MIRSIIWGLVIIAIGMWIWLAKLIIVIAGLLTVGEGISWAFRRGRRK
jgi:hypothetical protein